MKTELSKRDAQLFAAEVLGANGAIVGKKAPAQCRDCMNMLIGREIGQTPEGEASNIEIFDAWLKGFRIQSRKQANGKLLALGWTKEELGIA